MRTYVDWGNLAGSLGRVGCPSEVCASLKQWLLLSQVKNLLEE